VNTSKQVLLMNVPPQYKPPQHLTAGLRAELSITWSPGSRVMRSKD